MGGQASIIGTICLVGGVDLRRWIAKEHLGEPKALARAAEKVAVDPDQSPRR